MDRLNNRHRKSLCFLTPNEVFYKCKNINWLGKQDLTQLHLGVESAKVIPFRVVNLREQARSLRPQLIPDQVRDKLRRAETGNFNRDQY
jgi:hypothetical protein